MFTRAHRDEVAAQRAALTDLLPSVQELARPDVEWEGAAAQGYREATEVQVAAVEEFTTLTQRSVKALEEAAALHRAYALGWVGATVASAVLLLVPLDLGERTVIALLCGPLVGIAVHLTALRSAD